MAPIRPARLSPASALVPPTPLDPTPVQQQRMLPPGARRNRLPSVRQRMDVGQPSWCKASCKLAGKTLLSAVKRSARSPLSRTVSPSFTEFYSA
jgi:hypothetical protein